MPRFNHGVQINAGNPNASALTRDPTRTRDSQLLQSAFTQWEGVNDEGDGIYATGAIQTDPGISSPLQQHISTGHSLVNSDVARASHLSRIPIYDLAAAESLFTRPQPSSRHDVASHRYPPQWIPLSFEPATNVYSSIFATEGANHIHSRVREIGRFFYSRQRISNLILNAGLDVLRRAAASEVICDSSGPCPPPRCYPGTRRDILRTLFEWASETASLTGNILWLHGPMGAGKSAILGTLTKRLLAAGRLGGSFVFRRGVNAKALFCTIAYQLAINIPHLRGPILHVVQQNPAIVGETMAIQLQELILEPYWAAMDSCPLALVIDGLHECHSDLQREILCLLARALQNQPSSLRILLASRSEHHIADILATPCFNGICRSFGVGRSLKDVRTYLRGEFTRIQHNRLELTAPTAVPRPWIPTEVFNNLVEDSMGCFLYASTLVKFLANTNFYPIERLAAVENIPLHRLNSSLDTLYSQILATIPTGSRAALIAILHILTTEIFADLPLYHMEQLLRMKPGRLRRSLRHIHAVLNVPDSDDNVITVHHTSFLDFLVDPGRAGDFCTVGAQHLMYLARCILKSLAYTHQNPRVNRVGHISWTHSIAMVDYVTSVYPSAGLVPLVRRINPDFFFGSLSTFEKVGGKMLSWLNKIYPRPVEEIAVWEDYGYMAFFHSTVNDFDFDDEEWDTSTSSALHHQVLLHYPALIRLLRVSMALPALTPLFQFRILLGVSWSDLRTVVCALRPIFGRDVTALMQLWTPLKDPGFAREIWPWPTVFLDLACQSIRIAKGAYTGAVPKEMVGYWLEWGRYVRSSPRCSELLRELRGFVPRDDSEYGVETNSEVYDVLKWFEWFPDVPRNEILRWAGYLPAGTEFERERAYEARWTSWRDLRWCGEDLV